MKNNRENRIGWGKVCRWAGIWIRLSLFTLFILTEPLVVEAAGQSVTLRLENVSLKEAFKEIKRQLGYRLAYNEQVINTIGNVSVDVVSGNINEVMEQYDRYFMAVAYAILMVCIMFVVIRFWI